MSTGRRLAAILAADAVGFSARMAADETAALRAITACLEALQTVIGLHGGRVVKTMGDGLLAEFGSAVAAVSAAAAMQERLAERARDLPPEGGFRFRIGLHVGDVAVFGDDLLGDVVNVAARLEAAAPPGGVLVSDRVRENVAGRLELGFEDRGEMALKGIARPVRAHLLAGGAASAPAPPAPELPDKPSLAVLPFVNMSSDPEQEFFADGLTEDVTTALAQTPSLFVIARNSAFVYKGAAADVRKVGRDLGVRYVLEGSVRRAGGRLRITGQLIDAESGAHVWAERFDGAADDVFDLQDSVTEAVAAAIGPQVRGAEVARAARKRPDSLTAYDRFLKALGALARVSVVEARDLLDEAIAEDPRFARAIALRAWSDTLIGTWAGHGESMTDPGEGIARAEEALALAPDDPEVMAYAGYALGFFNEDPARGLALLRRSADRSPSFAWAWASIGMIEALKGDPRAAFDAAERATRLSPRDPLLFRARFVIACASRALGEPEQLLRAARETLALNPNIANAHCMVVQALHELGRPEEARAAAAAMTARFPKFRVDPYVDRGMRVVKNYGPEVAARIRVALLTAGLPA